MKTEKRIFVAKESFNTDNGHVLVNTMFFTESAFDLPAPMEYQYGNIKDRSISDYYEDITEVIFSNKIQELETKLEKVRKKLG